MASITRQQALLAGLLLVFVAVYYFREQIAVAVVDQAGKYWPLPPAGEPYRALIQDRATANGIPFDLLARQIQAESQFNPTVVASDGGVGLMQLTPKYYPGIVLTDPVANVTAGAASVAKYFAEFGSRAKALAAYNAGPSNVSRAIAAAEADGVPDSWLLYLPTAPDNQVITQKYVGKILQAVPVEPLPIGAIKQNGEQVLV